MVYAFGIIIAIHLLLFVLLLFVNSESKSTIFNDTSTAFIAKLILIVMLVSIIVVIFFI